MIDNWIFISFMAMIISSISVISLKIIDKSKYNNYIFILFSFICIGIISLFYLIFNKDKQILFKKNVDKNFILFTVLFGIILLFNSFIFQYSFEISPNISYSHIIINLNIIFTLIASYFLFKQQINIQCLFGIFLCLIGIFIIAYYSNKK